MELVYRKTDELFSKIFLRFTYFIFWLCWVFIAACELSLVVASGGYSLVVVFWLLIAVASNLLWSTGSRVDGFSSCGTWA